MAEIKLEELQASLATLTKKVEEQESLIGSLKESSENATAKVEELSEALTKLTKHVEGISSLPVEAAKKAPSVVLESAKNKSKGDNPVVHFSHEKKDYAFNADFVAVPAGVEGLAMGTKISAKAAQGNKELLKKLVETNSGQIKQVL